LFGARSILLVHIRFTLSAGPKGLKKCIPHKFDHGKKPFDMAHLHGP
jgi:hypothetical protein